MKLSPIIWRVLITSISVLAIAMLVSMDLDTHKIESIQSTDSPIKASIETPIDASVEQSSDQKDSAQLVLSAYMKALGGEHWNKVKTIHWTGLMSMKSGGSMALTYGKDMYQGLDGYLLEEISVNDSRLSQVMQDGEVMTIVRNNIYPQSGIEALTFKEYLLPLGNSGELNAIKAEYRGKELVKGRMSHKIFRGNQLGFDVYEYYDVNSHLKFMVSIGDECHMKFAAYKSINGVKLPSLIKTSFKEFQREITYQVEQVAINVAIPESPIDVKTLSVSSLVSN